MKMRKIIAIVAAVLMLFSILPISAMAATEIVFEFGANGSASHNDGSSKTSYSETNGTYTLNITGGTSMYTGARDAKGNSCIKLGTSSKTGGFSFTVPADVTSVIIAAAKYKTNTTKMTINGSSYTLSSASNNGAYDAIEIDTTSTKTITLTTVSGGVRAMVNSITYVVGGGSSEPECGHVYVNACDVDCNDCGEVREITHAYVGEETTAPTCQNTGVKTYTCSVCGDSYTEEIPVVPHNYVEGFCSVCGEEEPNVTEYTITFDANKTQRTEFSTSKQVWRNGALTFTNNKGSSTSNVADYGAPVRLYASSEVVIECPGMTQIVFDCNNATYANALKSSIGDSATVSSDKVTVILNGEDSFTIAKLSGQVRIDSITVTAEAQSGSACEHENAVACDMYCPDCGVLINEEAAHKSDAAYPCYDGTCEYCNEIITGDGHSFDENDVCTVCGQAPTPEKDVDPENPQEYVFSEFAAGEQYAENEKHYLDKAVTVITNKAHFTSELRIYSSSTNDATVVIKSTKDISAIVLNAGNKADVLNLYVSADGEVYEAINVTSSYKDYTVLIPEMTKYIKLDVAGENQVRIAKMTLYFDGETPHTHSYDNEYDADCNGCGEIREVEAPVATGGKSVSPDVEGLAFLFSVEADVAIAFERITEIDYANSSFGEYKLNNMGAKMSNGFEEITIDAKYLYGKTDSTATYAVRIVELDEDYKKDCVITATPFIVVEKDGVETTIWGETQSASYNGVLGG